MPLIRSTRNSGWRSSGTSARDTPRKACRPASRTASCRLRERWTPQAENNLTSFSAELLFFSSRRLSSSLIPAFVLRVAAFERGGSFPFLPDASVARGCWLTDVHPQDDRARESRCAVLHEITRIKFSIWPLLRFRNLFVCFQLGLRLSGGCNPVFSEFLYLFLAIFIRGFLQNSPERRNTQGH